MRTRIAICSLTVVAIVALPPLSASATPAVDLAKFSRLWGSKRIHNYRFRLRISCFCPTQITQPVTITVRRGRPSGGTESHKPFDTVPELFDVIASNIDSALANSPQAVYDRRYGFPTRVGLDPRKDAIDDETTVTVDRFRVLR
jgi:hypothetical protein